MLIMTKRKFTSNLTATSKIDESIIEENHSVMVDERKKIAKSSLGIVGEVVLVDPLLIDTWIYRDRKDFELGNIEELAESINIKGQAQPIILVKKSDTFKPKENNNAKYIVIAGYRRWLACKLINKEIKAVISDMDFETAVATLVAENEKENVSDYSKGLFFSNVIESENITQDTLHKRLGIPTPTLNRYLSFARVPKIIWENVGDLSKVTSRTSAEIAVLSKKGDDYIDALVEIADEIKKGIGARKVNAMVMNIVQGKENKDKKKEIKITYDGEKYMTLSGSKITLHSPILNHEEYKNIEEALNEFLLNFIGKK